MPNLLCKAACVKLQLERKGHDFPVSYNLGEVNTMCSPFKVRLIIRCFEKHYKADEMENAYHSLKKSLLLMAMEPIEKPCIKIELVTEVTINVLKIMFTRNDSLAKRTSQDWVKAVLANHLRSLKFAIEALKITDGYARTSPRRILGLRLAAHCGNVSRLRLEFY